MRVTTRNEVLNTERHVDCPHGGFTSLRHILEHDEMGFSLHETIVHPEQGPQHWHYKNHLEACYCAEGVGLLTVPDGRSWTIRPGTVYTLNDHDEHWFEALYGQRVVLVCVFNPPIKGQEVHLPDGSYPV